MNYKSIFRHYRIAALGKPWVHISIMLSYALAATVGNSVLLPIIYSKIIDTVTANTATVHHDLMVLIGYLAIIGVVSFVLYRLGDYQLVSFETRAVKKLYDYTLEKLQRHSYVFFSNNFTGSIIAKAKRFNQSFIGLYGILLWHIWLDGVKLVGLVAVMWYHSYVLALTFLGILALFGLLTWALVHFQVPKNVAFAKADSRTIARLSDVVTNTFAVKTFATSEREVEDFGKVTSDLKYHQIRSWFQEGFWAPAYQSLFVTVFEVVMMYSAIMLWQKGVITAGVIVLVQIYLINTIDMIWGMSKTIIRITGNLSDADEMVQIFDQVPDILDVENPIKLHADDGKIDFTDVTFKYESNTNVFNSLNLSIKPGEKVALVGHSGAGKTTFVKLLLRFLDIQGGTITIDGQDISKVAQEDLRRHIAYVPQDPSLFHRTLRENIAYAKPDATMEEIIEVAKRAHAHEFIEKLSDGYESLVGERGIKLSGGERQRIAIARAMLKDAPIIILDEATSALDSISEGKIQEAFQELMKGKTTIVIAHRLSTIRNMDRIIVFSEGSIAESGTHDELLKKKQVYAELWDSQVGGFIE